MLKIYSQYHKVLEEVRKDLRDDRISLWFSINDPYTNAADSFYLTLDSYTDFVKVYSKGSLSREDYNNNTNVLLLFGNDYPAAQ